MQRPDRPGGYTVAHSRRTAAFGSSTTRGSTSKTIAGRRPRVYKGQAGRPGWLGSPPPAPLWSLDADTLLGTRFVFGFLFGAQFSFGVSVGFFVFFLLLRILLRRQWIAIVTFIFIVIALTTEGFGTRFEG